MQFRDLGAQYRALKTDIDQGIQSVIESTSFILGAPVTELENKLAEYVGRKYCVSCGNGTDALQMSLMTWGIVREMQYLPPILLTLLRPEQLLFLGVHRFWWTLILILLTCLRKLWKHLSKK